MSYLLLFDHYDESGFVPCKVCKLKFWRDEIKDGLCESCREDLSEV